MRESLVCVASSCSIEGDDASTVCNEMICKDQDHAYAFKAALSMHLQSIECLKFWMLDYIQAWTNKGNVILATSSVALLKSYGFPS